MSQEQTSQEHTMLLQDVERKLTKTQKSALLAIAQPCNDKFPYWKRQKSMADLEKHGLVRMRGGTPSYPGWWITEKGRMVAEALKKDKQ